MEEQDQIIIKSLQSLKLKIDPNTQQSDFTFESMMSLIISYLTKLDEDTTSLTKQNKSNEKYRSAMKAINLLKKHGIKAEVPMILNPSPYDTRNFILDIISKSKFIKPADIEKTKNPEERIIDEIKQHKLAVCKNFIGKDWIHPDLIEANELQPKDEKFNFVDYEKYDPKSFKDKQIHLIKNNDKCNYIEAIDKFGAFRDDRNVKKDQSIIKNIERLHAAQQKKLQNQTQPNLSNIQQVYIRKTIANNDLNKTVTTADEPALKKANLQNENHKRINIGLITGIEEEKPEEQTIIRKTRAKDELEKQAQKCIATIQEENEIKKEKDDGVSTEQDRLECLRKENTSALEELNDRVDELNSELVNAEKQLKNVVNDIGSNEETYDEEKKQNKELNNEIFNKDQFQSALNQEGFQKKQAEENEKLAADIDEMEQLQVKTKADLNTQLIDSKKNYDEKTAEIQYLEEKIDFYEENYPNLMSNLKTAIENRNKLSQTYEDLPKDQKREQLADMIKSIAAKTKVHMKLTQSSITNIKNIKLDIFEGEQSHRLGHMSIGAVIKGEKKKDANTSKLINQMDTAQTVFDSTAKVLGDVIDIRTENKILEDKINNLLKNNYKEANKTLKDEQDVYKD